MHVVFVAFQLNTKGGSQRQALWLARAVKRLGHTVTVYAVVADYERCYGDAMRELDIRLVPAVHPRFSANPFLRKIQTKQYGEKSSAAIAEAIDLDADIINCQDEESYKVGFYYKKRTGRRDVVVSWTMNDPPFSYRTKSSFLFEMGRRVFNPFEIAYERRFLRAIDKIFVLDVRNQTIVRRSYRREAICLGSGVDFEYFFYPPHRITSERPLAVLGVGILLPYRRFEDIITAAHMLKEQGCQAHLNIAGAKDDTATAAALERLIRALSLENEVSLLGRVGEKELLSLYHESDVFVFPNHIQTFGLAPAEAMAAGLPVIISRTSGFSDFLKDGEEALLVDPLQPRQIAQKLKFLLAHPEETYRMSERGQNFVRSTMSWEVLARRFLNFHAK